MSIYEAALAAKDKGPAALQQILRDININVFDGIFKEFKPLEAFNIIMYVLHAYSEDSPWIILGVDWYDEKLGIAQRLDMAEYMRGWCVELANEHVRSVIIDYLDYQCKPEFKFLQQKQMTYALLSAQVVKQMSPGGDGKVDLSNFFDVNKELDKLHGTILKMQEEIKKKYSFYYIAAEEIIKRDSKMSNRFSGKVESSKWINRES